MAALTCKYCGTPATDAPACVNCGALIAPQHLGEVWPPPPRSLHRPGGWSLAWLITLGLVAVALNVMAIGWVLRLWPPGKP